MRIVIFFLLVITIASCKKQDSTYDILFTDPEPDISLVAGDDVMIDLDEDGVADILAIISEWEETNGPTIYTNSRVSFSAIDTGYYFSYGTETSCGDELLLEDEWVSGDLKWLKNLTVKGKQDGFNVGYWPGSDSYSGFVGIRYNHKGSKFYGWMRCTATSSTLEVHEYAMNRNRNQLIRAGQRE